MMINITNNRQFDTTDEKENVVDINEEDDDSSEATETDHEEGQTVNDKVAEESAPEGAHEVNMDIEKGTKMIAGVEENTMKTDEVVELELKIQKLEYECIEELESMLKQVKLERELEKNIEQLINEGLETKSNEKAEENHIEHWEFLYKTIRFCMKRTNGSVFYLDHIKEVLALPLEDIKRMIQLKEVRTSDKNTSQKSHEGSHDGELIYDETPQTISSILIKDAKLVSKQGHEEEVQGKNQAKEESGEVDITKLIKENKILDAESEKTPVGSIIGASNVQSPSTITGVQKVEFDVGNKQREERNRKLSERFCAPYVDREVSLADKIIGL
ncbi:hypothetical protein L1987_02550 [Smallanthus sonchifolius]|uniref:Uncharacterized protein n=1 Tax=Smallanthus sonchifolius TaxID=185202 RepID=A0ACB9K851_9ASTR|nr:hypothetical protein L1987_02550 [Smallanthus sonchifolius]